MSQLQLFDYSDLSPDLQVKARTTAERIRLRMKRTAEDIVEIGKDLINMKGELPHGKFLPWIESEFEMSRHTAENFIRVAERFSENDKFYHFKPSILYELAAPSTTESVIEQVLQDAETGETITLKDVKRLKVESKQKDAQIELAKQTIDKKDNALKGAELTMQDSAKSLAETMTKKATEDLTKKAEDLEKELSDLKSDKEDLEEAQLLAQSELKKAEEAHQKALEDFKANPDSETKAKIEATNKALDDLKGEEAKLSNELDRLKRRLENVRSVGENRAAMIATVNNFIGLFEQAVKAHPNILIAAASPSVDDAHADRMEDMVDFLEQFAGKLRKALGDRQFNQATEIRAVDVEIVDDEEDF